MKIYVKFANRPIERRHVHNQPALEQIESADTPVDVSSLPLHYLNCLCSRVLIAQQLSRSFEFFYFLVFNFRHMAKNSQCYQFGVRVKTNKFPIFLLRYLRDIICQSFHHAMITSRAIRSLKSVRHEHVRHKLALTFVGHTINLGHSMKEISPSTEDKRRQTCVFAYLSLSHLIQRCLFSVYIYQIL